MRRACYDLNYDESENFAFTADWLVPNFLRLLAKSPPDFNSAPFTVGNPHRTWFFRCRPPCCRPWLTDRTRDCRIFCGHFSLRCDSYAPIITCYSFELFDPSNLVLSDYSAKVKLYRLVGDVKKLFL